MSEQKAEAHVNKDAILAEVFNIYNEAGILFKKTTEPGIRNDLLTIKHGCDVMLERLMPLDARSEHLLGEFNRRFA